MKTKKNENQKSNQIKTKKLRFISPINRSLLIVSSLAISISLIVTWALAISLYRSDVDSFLAQVSTTLVNKGFNYTIGFSDFTIASLVLALFALLCVAIPFIFMRKKDFVSLMATIFSLLYALIIIIVISGIIYICYDALKTYINNNSITTTLLFLLPWSLELFFAVILAIVAIWLLITFLHTPKEQTNKIEKTKTLDVEETKEKVNKIKEHEEIIINDNIQQHPPINHTQPIVVTTPAPVRAKKQTPISNNNQVPNKVKKVRTTKKTEKPVIPEIKIFINHGDKSSATVASSPEKARVPNRVGPIPHEQIPIQEPIIEPIAWTPEEIETIWNKSEIVAGYDSTLYRKDYAGALMFSKAFVNHPTEETENNAKSYNWTIVLQKPINHGGSTEDYNLLAMNTMNYLKKGNDYPRWKTIITYDGRENVMKEKQWKDN